MQLDKPVRRERADGAELDRNSSPMATRRHMPISAGVPATLAQWADGAQLFDGLGNFHRASRRRPRMRRHYFDQGMRLLWAFNHDESTRSFAKAAQLDAGCAMCFWGVASDRGPELQPADDGRAARQGRVGVVATGQGRATQATPVEQALIGALAARYPDAKPLDPSNEGPVLTAYAQAMQCVAGRFPDDSDVQTLTAEAMMNINAWKLWALDGTPAAGTEEILALLERVLAKDPPASRRQSLLHPRDRGVAASREGGRSGRTARWHDARGRTSRAYARAHHAARRDATPMPPRQTARVRMRTSPITPRRSRPTTTRCTRRTITSSWRSRPRCRAARPTRWTRRGSPAPSSPTTCWRRCRAADWYIAETYAGFVRFGMWDAMLAEPAPNVRLQRTERRISLRADDCAGGKGSHRCRQGGTRGAGKARGGGGRR